ncbi:MAG: glycosyltransferase [Opitutales bacterium]|nr:glycosyltransferase [Opitutales bacterium]
MRICLVTTEYPPGPMGGVGTYATIMPYLLVGEGHEVVILTKHFDGSKPYERINGCEIHRLKTDYAWTGAEDDDELIAAEMRSLRSYVGIFSREVHRKIMELHTAKPFDLVLSQDVEAPTWYSQTRRMVMGELAELPFIVFVHSPHWPIQHYNEDSNYERHEYHRHIYERESMSLADGLIAASRSMKTEILKTIGPDKDKIALIPLPHGDIPAPADFQQRLGTNEEEELRIAFSGRVELRKGVEYLFEALMPLMEENPRITLHLFGRDTPHPSLTGSVGERLVKRYLSHDAELAKRVVFRGWMPRDELWNEYARATLGVVPSPWEPFSFACQEMMACGTPVVATGTGGMADMIANGRNGLLCEAGNADALRETISKALSAPLEARAKWGENAAHSIREYCDNKSITQETIAFFKNTIARNRKHIAKTERVSIPGNLPFPENPARKRHPIVSAQAIRKLGVIVPCYNLGEYLAECLDSIAAQDCESVEITTFVIDDGSTEAATHAALDEAQKRPAVKVCRHRNAGLPAARNRGAVEALNTGCDALLFIDCDDWIDTSYIRKGIDVLNRHPDCGAVTAWTHTIGRMHTYWAPPHPQFPMLLAECMSTPPAIVRSRSFLDAGGVHEDQRYAFEDWDFWISICALGTPILTIPEPLIFYRMREGSMSSQYKFLTREHGRKAMTARHEELYRRYAREVTLLQDAMYYEIQGRYHNEFAPIRKERDQLLIDVAWNQKEWKHFKGLLEEEQRRHDETKRQLEALRNQQPDLG